MRTLPMRNSAATLASAGIARSIVVSQAFFIFRSRYSLA
jgi:uncharacterized SAM-binding protein YcdF (DUF218 family)